MELFRVFGNILLNDTEFNNQLDDALKNGEKTSNGLIKSFDSFGSTLLKIGGIVGVGLGFQSMISSAGDFEKALNGIEASTGIVDEKMSGFRETLTNIYNNNFGDSFDDIAKSMETINQQSNATGKELEELTTNGLLLRDTFDFEVNESFRSANMLMQQFGTTGEEAYNLIAQGAQWGLNKNDDLLDTINEYSVQFKGLGFNADEMFTMLANGAMGGTWSVDKLGDAVKEFGIRVKDESDSTMLAFTSMGLDANKVSNDFAAGGEKAKSAFKLVTDSINNMKDPLKQNQTGVALFGTMWEDLGAKGIKALTETNLEISKSVNVLGEINKVKYNTPMEAIAGIGRQLQTGLVIPLGEKVLPFLNQFAQKVQEHMPQIKTVMENSLTVATKLMDGFKDSIKFVVDNSKILVPALIGVSSGLATFAIVNTVTSMMNKLTEVTKGMTIAQWALNGAVGFVTSPIGIAVIAVGALIAIGTALYMNWDKVSAFLTSTWNSINDIASNVWNSISSYLSGVWNNISTSITITWNKITSVTSSVWNGIKGFFAEWWPLLITIFLGPLGLLIGYVIGHWEQIKDATNKAWEAVKNTIMSVVTPLVNLIKDKFDAVSTTITNVFTTIKNFASTKWNEIKNVISKPLEDLSNKIKEIWNGINDKISGVVNIISNKISEFSNAVRGLGKNIVEGLWAGISSSASWLKDQIVGWLKGINSTIKDFFGIKSPSRLMAEYGNYINEGLAKGIGDNVDKAKSAALKMANAVSGVVGNIKTQYGYDLNFRPALAYAGSSNRSVESSSQTAVSSGEQYHFHGDIHVNADNVEKLIRGLRQYVVLH